MTEKQDYNKNGFILVEGLFIPEELEEIHAVVNQFHDLWLKDNAQFYEEKAINSAYLTNKKYLTDGQRMVLFKLLSSEKINHLLRRVIPKSPVFMNTQLFFNPKTPDQKNYWHRDTQYHMTLEQQQKALKGPEVLHIRVALQDEPGMEVIPGSHIGWDTQGELAVRLECDGHKSHEDLARGVKIPMQKGDVLLFSANMIHRGLYGLNRFALDLLYFESDPEIFKFINQDCLPNEQEMKELKNTEVFLNAVRKVTD